MTPIELLRELEQHADRLPSHVRTWLSAGLRRYRHDVPLEQALELTGPGARRCRDDALRRAAALLAPGEKPWDQAKTLQRAIRYTGSAGSQRTADPAASDTLNGYKLELWRAAHCGLAVPTSRRGLYRILVADNGDEFCQ